MKNRCCILFLQLFIVLAPSEADLGAAEAQPNRNSLVDWNGLGEGLCLPLFNILVKDASENFWVPIRINVMGLRDKNPPLFNIINKI